jgi:hypothetical protein
MTRPSGRAVGARSGAPALDTTIESGGEGQGGCVGSGSAVTSTKTGSAISGRDTVRTGSSSIAASKVVQTACWTEADRTRQIRIASAARAPKQSKRTDTSARLGSAREPKSIYPPVARPFRRAIRWTSRCNSRSSTTSLFTIPVSNCSTDPPQKRSIICRTARAATL